MFSQLIQLIAPCPGKCPNSSRRTRRAFRGRFEQLELRAMLTATIGTPDLSPETLFNTITDTFLVVPPPPEQSIQPSASLSTSIPQSLPNGDGEPPGPPPNFSQPQKATSPQQPTTWVQSTVTSLSRPEGTTFEVSAINGLGDSTHFDINAPAMSDALIPQVEHLLAHYGATKLIQQDLSRLDWRLIWTGTAKDFGSGLGGSPGEGGDAIMLNRPFYPGPDRYPDWQTSANVAETTDSLEAAIATAQGAPAYSIGLRAYESAFQQYSSQPRLLSLDQATSNDISYVSLAETHGNLDDGEGGFVELDRSTSSDSNWSHQASGDAESAAIDAVMAGLVDFNSTTIGNFGVDDQGSSAIVEGGETSVLAGSDALIDASGQGGMVLLRSAANTGGELTSLAGTANGPIDWSVPTADGKLEARVSVYQAFDVATGDLTSAAQPATPKIGSPAVKHEHDGKNHVSADKVAKPTTDQASAWVEMLTAAAVAGAAKKQRKSRTRIG
jgi:hypothetical protein